MSSYTPYAQRPGWSDLVPIPQADAPGCLVPIAYTEQYRDAMDTFRAIVKKQEKSERVVELTEVLIRINPGHYSIWAYRAETLLAIEADLSRELDLMDELVREHIKSYQVWQHRRTIVSALGTSSREIPFTTRALSFDAKNYHTWAYRQWALGHFFSSESAKVDAERVKVWQAEIEYTEILLEEDVRNNSAWNHRFFVSFESGESAAEENVYDRELKFVKNKISLAPNNPSAWNYLRGLLKRTETPLSSLSSFVSPFALGTPETMPKNEPPVSSGADLPAYLAIEFLADVAAEQATQAPEKANEAAALFKSLVQYDPIRTNYWLYRADEALGSISVA